MATILKNIRLEGKSSDFLSRITSDPGTIYYNRDNNTLVIYDGDISGGSELLKSDLSNIAGGGAGGGNIDFGSKTLIAEEFQGDFVGNLIGNAATATKLLTARNINGVSFDGSADIIIDTAGSTTSANPPNDPASGDIWFNSDTGIQYIYTGSQWVQPFSSTTGQDLSNLAPRTNPTFTGLMTVNANSDFNGTVQFDNTVTFNSSVSGLTKSTVGLANVTNESKETMFASPVFTGIPLAPTAVAGTNTTQIATTAYVTNAITNLIGAAPTALNTLSELSDALNDDANYAATITTALSLKAPLASPTFSGTVNLGTEAGFATGSIVSSFSTDLSMSNNSLTAVPVERVVKTYVDNGLSLKANIASPSFTGTVSIGTILANSTVNVNGIINASTIRASTKTGDVNISGTYTMDCSLFNNWAFTVTGATTLAFSNIPSAGRTFTAIIIITQGGGGSIASFPSGTTWPGAVAPTLTTTTSRTDVFQLTTVNGGTTWFASVIGQNYS